MLNTYIITNIHTNQTAKIYGRTFTEARLNACAPADIWKLEIVICGKW